MIEITPEEAQAVRAVVAEWKNRKNTGGGRPPRFLSKDVPVLAYCLTGIAAQIKLNRGEGPTADLPVRVALRTNGVMSYCIGRKEVDALDDEIRSNPLKFQKVSL